MPWGGAEREDSVYSGLMAVSRDMDVVMVHDGARPFAGPDWYDQGAAMMETAKAAIYGIPLKDTVKVRGDDGRLHTLNRSRLVAAQTPQIFHRDLLVEAMSMPGLKAFRLPMMHPSSKPWACPSSSLKGARRTAR